MKKSIALVLAIILLVGIIGTALACSHNNWHTAGSYNKTETRTIAKKNGCINLSNPHTHSQSRKVTVTVYVCFTCGDTKHVNTKYYDWGPEVCPKH